LRAIRSTNADYDTNPDCNSYRYSFTYTNSNCQAVANAENSAHTKAAPNSPAETIAFARGQRSLKSPFASRRESHDPNRV
jgi:hypothetical protein